MTTLGKSVLAVLRAVCSSSKVYGMSQPLPPAAELRWERRHSQKCCVFFFFPVDSLLIMLLASAALAVRPWGEWPAGRTEDDVFSALCWEEVLELVPSSGFG